MDTQSILAKSSILSRLFYLFSTWPGAAFLSFESWRSQCQPTSSAPTSRAAL